MGWLIVGSQIPAEILYMWRCIAPNEWQPLVVYIEKYKYCYKVYIYGAFSPDTKRITLPNCRLTSSRSTSWVSCGYISNVKSEDQ